MGRIMVTPSHSNWQHGDSSGGPVKLDQDIHHRHRKPLEPEKYDGINYTLEEHLDHIEKSVSEICRAMKKRASNFHNYLLKMKNMIIWLSYVLEETIETK